MITVMYNRQPVRTAFEDGTMYFVWCDIAKAMNMPTPVIRRIPKTVYEFEKRNLRGVRSDGAASTRILAISACGLYRMVCESEQISDSQRPAVKDWIMRMYAEQSARLNSRMKGETAAEKPYTVYGEDPDSDRTETPTVREDDGFTRKDLYKLAKSNIDIINKLLSMEENKE